MWTLLLSYLTKPKILAGFGLAIALFSAFMWYGAKRESAGYAAGNRAQLETDKIQFQQLQKQYQAKLDEAQSRIDASDAKIAVLTSQIQTLNAQISALQTLRQQSQQHIATLPDNVVQEDLETKLGGPLTDTAILRKADQIITDYPIVVKELETVNNKVDTLTASITELNTKVEAITTQRDAAIQFGDQVVGYYTKAYNAAQVKHSLFIKIITLGLVRDKHLDLPSPTSLKR